MRFRVIDTKTGKEPDMADIALHEDWAKSLMYCDMEGFAVQDDGTLILCDECGQFAYCPQGRFKVEMLKDDELGRMDTDPYPISEEMLRRVMDRSKGIPDPVVGEDDDL